MTPDELTPYEEEMLERIAESDDPRDWSDGDPDDLPYEDDDWHDADSFASAGWGEDEMYEGFDYDGGIDV